MINPKKMDKKEIVALLKKIWYFIWESNSIWSWLVNVVLAYVLIKFIVYPGLGFLLQTSHPIVAVVSSSMEHKSIPKCAQTNNFSGDDCVLYVYEMCGKVYKEKKNFGFEEYWSECSKWYLDNTPINKELFSKFSMKNGFNKGDIIILFGKKPEKLEIGDIIVFIGHRESPRADPIIHRIVSIKKNGEMVFQTKGDNNQKQINGCIDSICTDETDIRKKQIIGKAIIKIPYLGYIKIWFVEMLKYLGVV